MTPALEAMPGSRRALEEGELTMSAVRVLAAARDADPSEFERCEAELVEAARIHSIQDLQRVTAYWRQAVEQDHALNGDEMIRDTADSMPRSRSWGWCAWTATWPRRPGRRS